MNRLCTDEEMKFKKLTHHSFVSPDSTGYVGGIAGLRCEAICIVFQFYWLGGGGGGQ